MPTSSNRLSEIFNEATSSGVASGEITSETVQADIVATISAAATYDAALRFISFRFVLNPVSAMT
jgi:hypothetical protein